jgi:hypothetical protein
MPGYLCGRSCRLGSSLYQRLGCLRSDVVDHHWIAGLLDIPGDGTTYGTQTYKAYHFHFSTSRIGAGRLEIFSPPFLSRGQRIGTGKLLIQLHDLLIARQFFDGSLQFLTA